MIDKEKIEKEIEDLAKQGINLYFSVFKIDPEGLAELKKIKVDIDSLPNFEVDYEDWYTKSYRLVQNVAPYRLNDFVSLYKLENIKNPSSHNYRIANAILGQVWSQGSRIIAKPVNVAQKVKMQAEIVGSLKSLINDYFYNLEIELESNIFDSELDSAKELLKKKFLRPSGVICGVVLEKHLKNVCDNHGIQIAKKDPGISEFNDKLKESKVIDVPTWRKIQLLGDIRNICAHNKGVEPTAEQVQDLLDGTKFIISTIF